LNIIPNKFFNDEKEKCNGKTANLSTVLFVHFLHHNIIDFMRKNAAPSQETYPAFEPTIQREIPKPILSNKRKKSLPRTHFHSSRVGDISP
jgi:hypothetical protein